MLLITSTLLTCWFSAHEGFASRLPWGSAARPHRETLVSRPLFWPKKMKGGRDHKWA